jgi:arylsulfatase A-like enzyme
LLDVYPTLIDLLGLPIPAGLDGRTLRPLLEGKPVQTDGRIYAEKHEGRRAKLTAHQIGNGLTLVSPPWKLVLNLADSSGSPSPRYELYRIDADPGERRNLADEESQVVAQLAATLEAWAAPLGAGSAGGPTVITRGESGR